MENRVIIARALSHPYLDSSDSKNRINEKGHRSYVGGSSPESWYGIGKLQYTFLIEEGLRPNHTFLDIACGSLRLGQFLIPYLDKGKYYGIDAEKELIQQGIKYELSEKMMQLKKPILTSNYEFDFSFIESFDFAIAQSLFTHLILEDIALCLKKLYLVSHIKSKFYFTFFRGDANCNKWQTSHANRNWLYSVRELKAVAEKENWHFTYLGDWKHPSDQKMVLLTRGQNASVSR